MPNTRILWLDVVRFFAILMLICCHSADPFNFFPGPEPANIAEYQWWGAVWGSLMRPCVPLFAMLTGALLLPVKGEVPVFYRKRIGRVIWPFLIWSCIYGLFPWFLGLLGCEPQTVLNFFPYSGDDALKQSFSVSLGYIAQIPLNFNAIAVHMWYIYMLIGLYLYLPIFSAWVEKASERAKLYFLCGWGVTLLVPYLHRFLRAYLWGECDWNEFGMLYYFAGFNGYLLLGHYLRNHIMSVRRALPIGIVLFVVGYGICLTGFRWMTVQEHTSLDLELFWYYCSPQVVMMTSAMFIIIAACGSHILYNNRLSQSVSRWGTSLTRCGFGIYMIHYLMTGPGVQIMRHIGVSIPLQIPCAAILVFAVSWAITALIHKILPSNISKIIMG